MKRLKIIFVFASHLILFILRLGGCSCQIWTPPAHVSFQTLMKIGFTLDFRSRLARFFTRARSVAAVFPLSHSSSSSSWRNGHFWWLLRDATLHTPAPFLFYSPFLALIFHYFLSWKQRACAPTPGPPVTPECQCFRPSNMKPLTAANVCVCVCSDC